MFGWIRITALLVLLVFSTATCAPRPGGPGESADTGRCGAAAGVGALIGGVAGALLGGRDNLVLGAAIGAGIGGVLAGGLCLAVNSNSRQTRDAAAVERQYKASKGGQLPDTPVVQQYNTSLTPSSGTLRKGEELVIHSQAVVVSGQRTAADKVSELVEIRYDSKTLQKFEKELPVQGSGAYETDHSIRIPSRFQEGRYAVATTLQVNGKSTGPAREVPFLVVSAPDGVHFALLEHSGR